MNRDEGYRPWCRNNVGLTAQLVAATNGFAAAPLPARQISDPWFLAPLFICVLTRTKHTQSQTAVAIIVPRRLDPKVAVPGFIRGCNFIVSQRNVPIFRAARLVAWNQHH